MAHYTSSFRVLLLHFLLVVQSENTGGKPQFQRLVAHIEGSHANVALREYDDIDGLTEGWLTYDVNASGVAAAKLHLNRLNTTVEFNTCVNDDGTIFFYAPAYPNARGDGYVGEIAGTLTITPVSERQTSADIVTDTWISSGKDMFSKLMLGTGEIIPLTPTGTTFLSNRSIAYCVGTSVMYFVAECPEGAYVPNYVKLSENRALTLSNASEGPLSQELSDIVVNPQDGTFTGTLTVLAANDDDSSTVRFADIPFSGLMVPTTNQCCGGSANIAVGYGSYLFGDNVYRIRIFADQTYSALAAPTVATAGIETIDGHDIHVVRCTVPPIAGLAKPIRALLCKNDAGEFCVYTWDDGANTVELYLDGEYAWQISSLAVDERLLYLEGQPAAESTAATAAAVRMITYGTTADVDVRLTPGWNLIGVPSTLQVLLHQRLPAGCASHPRDGAAGMVHDGVSRPDGRNRHVCLQKRTVRGTDRRNGGHHRRLDLQTMTESYSNSLTNQ